MDLVLKSESDAVLKTCRVLNEKMIFQELRYLLKIPSIIGGAMFVFQGLSYQGKSI